MSDRALWQHFFSELCIRDSAFAGLVELVDEVSDLFVGDCETARLNHAAELINRDATVIVKVKGVERLVNIEAGESLESLPDNLARSLSLEVNAPNVAVLQLGVSEEAVVATVERRTVVRGTAV